MCSSRLYACWLGLLGLLMLAGFAAWMRQLDLGLQVTGLGRHMSWGLYIAQFTFLVGVAASAVALTLPARLHGRADFARPAVFGEGLAVAAASMGLLCVLVDLGRPHLLLNVILHPSPRSLMFWDMLALTAYLLVNLLLLRAAFTAERQDLPPPSWHRPLLALSIPLAVSIHVITAMLYAGLPGRHYWLTAVLAARFLASAFSSGPAVLLLLLLIVRRLTCHDAVTRALPGLRLWIVYALAAGLLLSGLELFTDLYGGIPSMHRPLDMLFAAPDTAAQILLAGSSAALALLLLIGSGRHPAASPALIGGLALTVFATWLDKGPLLMRGGFSPSPFGDPIAYTPTLTECVVLLGIHATGLLILTLLWRPVILFRKNSQLASENRP